jgi:hypothetical protein
MKNNQLCQRFQIHYPFDMARWAGAVALLHRWVLCESAQRAAFHHIASDTFQS